MTGALRPEEVDGELVDDAVDAWHEMPRPLLLDDQMRYIPPYPFTGPGEPAGDVDHTTCTECGSEPRGDYPVVHKATCSHMTIAPHLWPSPIARTPRDAEDDQWRWDEREIDGGFCGCEF